jgi:hypothetical protein
LGISSENPFLFGLSITQILGILILFSVVTTLSYINAKEYEKENRSQSAS